VKQEYLVEVRRKCIERRGGNEEERKQPLRFPSVESGGRGGRVMVLQKIVPRGVDVSGGGRSFRGRGGSGNIFVADLEGRMKRRDVRFRSNKKGVTERALKWGKEWVPTCAHIGEGGLSSVDPTSPSAKREYSNSWL